jgi:hypothetical protein
MELAAREREAKVGVHRGGRLYELRLRLKDSTAAAGIIGGRQR